MAKVKHELEVIHQEGNKILILGSFPSLKSRETSFYYGHPQNRFWKILAAIYEEKTPDSNDEKKAFLTRHGLSMYDSLESCEITNSSDASIKNEMPSDLSFFLSQPFKKKVILNGRKAAYYFRKYQKIDELTEVIECPSTSPANAKMSLEALIECYKKAILG